MTATGGQASVEYAGLLALAAVIGASLALVAGPPLAHAVRTALVRALSAGAHNPAAIAPGAADIADVQSALRPGEDAMSPDAALLALAQRHGTGPAAEIADAILLAAARTAAPWLATTRVYRAWKRSADGPYRSTTTTGDRDVESPIGPPVVTWTTAGEQRRLLAIALAHHTEPAAVALDLVGSIPLAKVPVIAGVASARLLGKIAFEVLPESVEALHRAVTVVELLHSEEGGVPPEVGVGDVVIAWPVRRTFWRGGRSDRRRAVDYEHRVVLRPGAGGLQVVAEEIGT